MGIFDSAVKRRILKYSLILAILLTSIMIGIAAGVIAGSLRDIPSLDQAGTWLPSEVTRIYSADGEILAQLHGEERRIVISLDEVSPDIIKAIIAIEDTNFYAHHGIDPWGLMRALWVRITESKIHGGSTITQQLAKNAFLTHDQTITRKIQDMFLALQLERKYTKDEILEFYLNQVYFGHGAYGIETAAHTYFGKSTSELSLAESALLAGIIRGPGYYSPYINIRAAQNRRSVVLNRMEELGFISTEEAEKAKNEPLELYGLDNIRTRSRNAPYFTNFVRDELIERFGADAVYRSGLRVYTTLDPDLQRSAEEIIYTDLPIRGPDANGLTQPQGALISIDPHTGHILAMVGGRGEDQFNRTVQSYRQPGSALKPFIYALALEEGYNPASKINDVPIEFHLPQNGTTETWNPRNYTNTHQGPTRLRTGLADSINVLAVRLMHELGVERSVDYMDRFGIRSLVTNRTRPSHDYNLSVALGGLTRGVTPLELAQAYGVFATQGIRSEPFAIRRVEDRFGNTLFEQSPQREVVLDEKNSYLMVDMLKSVITDGTGRRANIDKPAAGKTGTTTRYTDAWFIGFTPELVTAVWIGEDTPRPMIYDGHQVSSGVAAELWRNYMLEAVTDNPGKSFNRPSGLVSEEVCEVSGKLPGPYCRGTVEELFVQGQVPEEKCDLHREIISVEICTEGEDWQLATDACPSDTVVIKYYQKDTGILVNHQGLPMTSFMKRTYPESPEEYRKRMEQYLIPAEECEHHEEEESGWGWFWNR